MKLSKCLTTIALTFFLAACENTVNPEETKTQDAGNITAARERCETILKDHSSSCGDIIEKFEVCVNKDCSIELDENILKILVEKYGNEKGEVLLQIRSATHETKTEQKSTNKDTTDEKSTELSKKEIAHKFYDECSKLAASSQCIEVKYDYAECELAGKENCEEFLDKAIHATTPEVLKNQEKHVFYDQCIKQSSSETCISLKPDFVACLDDEISEDSKKECTEKFIKVATEKDSNPEEKEQPKEDDKKEIGKEDELRHQFYDTCVKEASSESCITLKAAFIECLGEDLEKSKMAHCTEDKTAEAVAKDGEKK